MRKAGLFGPKNFMSEHSVFQNFEMSYQGRDEVCVVVGDRDNQVHEPSLLPEEARPGCPPGFCGFFGPSG